MSASVAFERLRPGILVDVHQTAIATIADAILDRLINGAYRIEMTAESMRKKLSALTETEG
jgi:hypothetical protein